MTILQNKAAFWRWLANPQSLKSEDLDWNAQIEIMSAQTRSILVWRRLLRNSLPYKAEQILMQHGQGMYRQEMIGNLALDFAVGIRDIGPCLNEIREDLIEEWCEFAEQNGADLDGPESQRSPEFRMFSILVREGLDALRPKKNLARAVAALAHHLAQEHHFQPRAAINDIILWAKSNTSVSSGEEAAFRSMCRKIWNSYLRPVPATVAMMNKVLQICPSPGARSPKKNLVLRRITCLTLLRRLSAQVLAWGDGIVDIPSDWFTHPGEEKRGVSSGNYKRLLMDPLMRIGVLVLHQKHSRARNQSTRYRFYLASKGELGRVVPAAEKLLGQPDFAIKQILGAA